MLCQPLPNKQTRPIHNYAKWLMRSLKNLTMHTNNNDAAAVAALFTEDAVLVNDTGPIYGREAIEKMYADLFQKVHFSNHIAKLDQYSPHIIGTTGNEMWWNGEWSVTVQGQTGDPIQTKGYWTSIVVRDGDAWKDRMQIWNAAPTPAK